MDGAFESLPLERSSVDYVFSIHAFHWVSEASRAIKELARVLKPSGEMDLFFNGCSNGREFIRALAAGGSAIVMNESLRPRQIEHVLGDASAAALITDAELLDRLSRPLETACRILDVRDVPPAGEVPLVSRVPMDPAQITYTSGSTGLPKGVTVSHDNLRVVMETVIGYLGITAEDRIASILPFSFVYGMSQVLCAVGTGAALVVERSPLALDLVSGLRAREITVRRSSGAPIYRPRRSTAVQTPSAARSPGQRSWCSERISRRLPPAKSAGSCTVVQR